MSLVILVSGCSLFNKPKVDDPCAKAITFCYGPAGVSPDQVPACRQLIACLDWEMSVKK